MNCKFTHENTSRLRKKACRESDLGQILVILVTKVSFWLLIGHKLMELQPGCDSNCCSSFPRMPSYYQVVLWKQDRFMVLDQFHCGARIWHRSCKQVYAIARHA